MVDTQKQVAAYVETIRKVDAALDPTADGWVQRKRIFGDWSANCWQRKIRFVNRWGE